MFFYIICGFFRSSTVATIEKDQTDHKHTKVNHSQKTDEIHAIKSSSSEYQSVLERMKTTGQNSELIKGPNEDLLL